MFDEKSNKWIKIYKRIAIVLFWLNAIGGFFAGLDDGWMLQWGIFDIGIGGGGDGFFDFLGWLIIGVGIGYIQLTANMLIIQLLNNVQIIREKLEQK